MARVELIYDRDCPNVQDARKVLLEAFAEVGLQPSWTEWDRKSPESPFHVRQYGSPTVLVDGRDVVGVEPADDLDNCRLYQHGPGEMRGVPPLLSITEALGNDLGRLVLRVCPAGS